MHGNYGRDLDLNLLRVFAVVADAGSVTAAAARLYLTQPAVSAALKRLATAVGAPLFARQGRGLVLTARGERLVTQVRPLLQSLADAVVAPAAFDPASSDRTLRLGLADSAETWLLPLLLRTLERVAPRMRLVVLPVQFRTVGELLTSQRVDAAVTVADELPAGTQRRPIFVGGFVCVYDPRHVAPVRAFSREAYFAREHVVVSYNGDLRGVVEDVVGTSRRVRCSVSSFHAVGAVVAGTSLLATVPVIVARDIVAVRPHLRTAALPFALNSTPLELIWRDAVDDDAAWRFVREHIVRLAGTAAAQSEATVPARRPARGRAKRRSPSR